LPSLTAAAAVSGFAAPPAAAVEPSSSAAVASVAAAVAVAAVAAVADVHTGLIAPFAVAPVAPVALDLVAFPDPYLEGEALPEPEPGPFSQDYHMDWLLLEASSDAQA